MATASDSTSIGAALLAATCTAALLPAALLAGWLLAAERSGASAAPTRALADAEALADALDRWFARTQAELRAWSEIPALIEGVRRAAVEHHERGYTEQTPEEVNALLVHDGTLALAAQADEYLAAQLGRSPTWTRVHYTDEYGFTVGVVGVEDDFVQTDETWWRRAWTQGRYEGAAELDPAIGALGIRVALRIDDPATDAAVGVMDGTVALVAIHRLADAHAERTGAAFRVLDADGALVAETASGHARDRIVKLSEATMTSEGWRTGVGGAGRTGAMRDGAAERGWTRLAEAEGPHRDWIVIAERAGEGATPRGTMAVVGAVLALALAAGLAGGLWLRRRVAVRLGALADSTERMLAGDTRTEIPAEGSDEIARVARAVERARSTIRRALQIVNR